MIKTRIEAISSTNDIATIGHDCMAHSEIKWQQPLTSMVIKRKRVCRACSRVWTTTETFKGFLTESTDEVQAKILRIVHNVCYMFKVDESALLGPNRNRNLSMARHVAMYLAKKEGYSYPKIGAIFNNRHHTTIMYGCQHVEKAMKAQPALESIVRILQYKEVEAESND
jgi:chromosomal replication initiation ATPase DnaA